MNFKRLISLTFVTAMFVMGAQAANPVKETYFEHGRLKLVQMEELKRMSAAHEMASSARALGLSEDSETILLAKSIWEEANQNHTLVSQQMDDMGEPVMELVYDAFTVTGISAEGFDSLLEGTDLEGCGQYFQRVETEYGVNGLFALSVAKVESGLGSSPLAKNENNFFGMLGCSYDSKESGILAFGKLISQSSYYTEKTIEQIAKTYCPPTWSKWAGDVEWCMGDFWDKLVIEE